MAHILLPLGLSFEGWRCAIICMFVCVCQYFLYEYVYAIYLYVCTYLCMFVYMYEWMNVRMNETCERVQIWIWVWCMYVHMNVCMREDLILMTCAVFFMRVIQSQVLVFVNSQSSLQRCICVYMNECMYVYMHVCM